MKRLLLLTLISLTISLSIFFLKKKDKTMGQGEGLVIKKEWLAVNKNPVTPAKDVRPPDQTFLTFPEWYLVFSPEEQAEFFKTQTASNFPYVSHISHFWRSYDIACKQIKGNFEYNGGYHFMIWVIGTSTTGEYLVKSWYETVFGRITDTGTPETDEDKFAMKYTADYVAFIKDRPWYEFDFNKQLSDLWGGTSFFGSHMLRKLERKYFLTNELLAKAAYGILIGLGTKTVYDEALPTTAVLVDSLPNEISYPLIKKFPDGSALINLPRYDKFNPSVCTLAEKGVNVREIAGNTSAILFTALAPRDWHPDSKDMQIVFSQPVSTNPNILRVAITTPVKMLCPVLRELHSKQVKIEHVFDF